MRITVEGIDIFATTGGRDPDPALPAAIFLHGAGMDQSVWALHSRWFAHHGWSVLAVDLPGHGRSGGTLLPSIGAMADWVAQLITAMGRPRVSLIGHSMGSLVALETAARYPDRIQSLGLVGTAPAMPVHPDMLAAAKANSPDAIAMVSLWGHGAHATMGGSPTPGQWMLGSAVRLLERARPDLIHNDLAACDAYRNGLAAAAGIACPVTIVVGEKDVMTPLKAVKLLASSLRQVQVTVLKGAGHMLMAERPDEVLEALRNLA